jgi:hypothetical protein
MNRCILTGFISSVSSPRYWSSAVNVTLWIQTIIAWIFLIRINIWMFTKNFFECCHWKSDHRWVLCSLSVHRVVWFGIPHPLSHSSSVVVSCSYCTDCIENAACQLLQCCVLRICCLAMDGSASFTVLALSKYLHGMQPVVCHIITFYATIYTPIVSANKSTLVYHHSFVKGVATCFNPHRVIIRWIYRNVLLVIELFS